MRGKASWPDLSLRIPVFRRIWCASVLSNLGLLMQTPTPRDYPSLAVRPVSLSPLRAGEGMLG